MLDDRKLAVLRAIVEDFVSTHEPVGSKGIVERHSLGVSPATIRNDMAVLEDEGYIVQPHTSAGRIPTDKGYRLFVDRLSTVKPLSAAERRAITNFLEGAVDLDDVMRRSVKLLAHLTRQVALVQYPSLVRSAVRHVELVSLGPNRILLVLIADTGRVEQRVVNIHDGVTDESLSRIRTSLNTSVSGRPFIEVAERVADLAEQFEESERPVVASILATLLETAVERHEERVVVTGTSNLARARDGLGDLRPVLEALEEQMVLLRLLGESPTEDVSVLIGRENDIVGMSQASVVSAGYGPVEGAVARLGVVGPTFMDYPGTIGSVRAVARYLGRIVGEQ